MRVLFLTHAYPRFAGDPVGSFIANLAVALRDDGVDVIVSAPSAPDLPLHDTLDGIRIERFRYAPRRLETTDPLAIEPFAEAVLRIPVRGEQLVAERRAVVAHELVVGKRLRHETVEVRGTVRKERVEADQPTGDRPERRPESRGGE